MAYVGKHHKLKGYWIGVQLDGPNGRSAGSFGGKQYFVCAAGRGILVPADKVAVVKIGKAETKYKEPKVAKSSNKLVLSNPTAKGPTPVESKPSWAKETVPSDSDDSDGDDEAPVTAPAAEPESTPATAPESTLVRHSDAKEDWIPSSHAAGATLSRSALKKKREIEEKARAAEAEAAKLKAAQARTSRPTAAFERADPKWREDEGRKPEPLAALHGVMAGFRVAIRAAVALSEKLDKTPLAVINFRTCFEPFQLCMQGFAWEALLAAMAKAKGVPEERFVAPLREAVTGVQFETAQVWQLLQKGQQGDHDAIFDIMQRVKPLADEVEAATRFGDSSINATEDAFGKTAPARAAAVAAVLFPGADAAAELKCAAFAAGQLRKGAAGELEPVLQYAEALQVAAVAAGSTVAAGKLEPALRKELSPKLFDEVAPALPGPFP